MPNPSTAKVAIVGAGTVGATIAFSLIVRYVPNMTLLARHKEGEEKKNEKEKT